MAKFVSDNFIDIPFTTANLDRYVVRKAIFKALTEHIPFFKGKLLDVGCGKMPYKNYLLENSEVSKYVGLDIDSALPYDVAIKPDFTWNGKVMPFENESFDCCIATEVLEHCPNPEDFLKEVHRVLKPKAVFFFTVPFLWNLHEVPHDEYRFTPFSLSRHLNIAGFDNIEIKATGGWHAAMAQMLGLWVRRAPMKSSKRKFLSIIFLPFIKYLLDKGIKENIIFKESQMITGLYGTARKY
jgi:SAM-dependent methyltransferase